MALSLSNFQKWQKSRQATQPEPEKLKGGITVVQSLPQPKINGVIQAKPQATITGVVSSKPTQTVVPQGFVGPVKPKEEPSVSSSSIFKSISESPDMLGAIKSKAQSAITSPESLISTPSTSVFQNFVSELPGSLTDTAKDVIRAPIRTGVSFIASATGQTEDIVPETKAQKFLVGDEPIKPAARKTADLELYLKDKGFNKTAFPVALAGVVGEGFLDLYPGTSGKNKLLREGSTFLTEQLAKGIVKEEALNTLYKRFGTKIAQQVEKEALPKILEQGAKTAGEQGIKVYHGTNMADNVANGVQPDYTLPLQKAAGTDKYKVGFSVTTDKKVAEGYGSRQIEYSISPEAKIAKPSDLPEVKFTTHTDGEVTYNMHDAVVAAKKKVFDGVDVNAFEELTTNPSKNKEIQIFNPNVLKPSLPEITGKERGFITSVKESANNGARELKFINTVKNSPRAPQVLRENLQSIATIGKENQETLRRAQEIVNGDINDAWKFATQTRPTAESFATAELLADKLAKEGDWERAIDLVEITAKKAKQEGQAIQALSMYDRLTPEGVLRYAQRQITQANELLPVKKQVKLTPEFAEALKRHAENLQTLKPGSREKAVETAKMLKRISDEIPAGVLKKVSLVQTMGQLLNPKTLARNIIGNTGFAVTENVKDVVATPLDWFVSKFTGQRTKTLPDIVAQAKGFKKGLVEGFEDAWLGIDTSAAATQFDLPKGQVFKDKMLGGLEKTLSVALKAPDRAAYQAAFENSLFTQMKLAKVTQATPEMLHIAHLDGLYRTFQDESTAAKVFMGIKKALNAGKDFGVGDVVLKYPKTPGNLLTRGIEYSPAGFLRSVVELAKPMFGHSFDQRAFVESVSRAFTGTSGLVGLGALMHRLGLITGKRNDDPDLNTLERSIGLGQYKFNMSGLARFVLSGFDTDEAKLKEGDKTISFDWFQPNAIGVSMGANLDELSQGGEVSWRNNPFGALLVSLAGGVDTLGEQPLVQGITRPFKYSESFSEAALNALQGVPTSFIPTLLGQARQITDPNQRNTQDPKWTEETLNLAKNKIPGLSQLLPKKFGSLGESLVNENSILETFVSPAYVDKYQFTKEQKAVLDIYKNSGIKTQAPRLVSANQTVNGKTIKLTGEQQSKMQEAIGKLTQQRFAGLVDNPKFQRMSDEKKAQTMANIMSDIFTAAKYIQLGHRPKKLSAREKKYIRLMRESR